MTDFGWTLTALGIVGALLNVAKNPWCFVLWSIANVGLVVRHAEAGRTPDAVLFGVYLVISLWGMFTWAK